MEKIKVAICEDMKQVREYFAAVISAQEDMEAVAATENGADIIEAVREKNPEIVIMDIQMETERAGIDATAYITENYPNVKVIIATVHDDDELVFEAFTAGAVDYVLKNENENELLEAIRNAHANNTQFNHVINKKIVNEFKKMKKERQSLMYVVTMMCNLSPTELQTLSLLCDGVKRSEIARSRCVELVTVHTMVGRIMKKLGYKNSFDMIEDIKRLDVLKLIKDLRTP